MKNILVGYTGFVGGNIAAKHHFDGLYNSKNIMEALAQIQIYSCIPVFGQKCFWLTSFLRRTWSVWMKQ